MSKKLRPGSIMIDKQVYLSSMNLFAAYLADLGMLVADLEHSETEIFELTIDDLHAQLDVLGDVYMALSASVSPPVTNSSVESLN